MKLYVIRHGQSETNVIRCYTGWSQVNLTPQGIEDAKSIRPLLENIPFDKIYSSDLIRAMHTAETAIPGCSYETTPLLREIGMGSLEHQSIDAMQEELKANNTAELGYAMYGGESREQMVQRATEFLKLVESLDCEYVAAFSHWGMLMNILNLVLGVRVPGANITGSNCVVGIFEYKNSHWKLHSWINQ